MSSLEWKATHQVVERIFGIRGKRQRQRLLDYFDRLCVNPDGMADESFQGEDGDQYYSNYFEQWVITYKVDEAVSTLEVLALELP